MEEAKEKMTRKIEKAAVSAFIGGVIATFGFGVFSLSNNISIYVGIVSAFIIFFFGKI